MGLPSGPGMYVITCGDCLAHVGTSGGLAGRVRQLARLGTHRGSAEVLCAAFCTAKAPVVWWEELPDAPTARSREREFKNHYGEPPAPRSRHAVCVNGDRLREELVRAAGSDSWEAGFIDAVFKIGEKLELLFTPRFDAIWTSESRQVRGSKHRPAVRVWACEPPPSAAGTSVGRFAGPARGAAPLLLELRVLELQRAGVLAHSTA